MENENPITNPTMQRRGFFKLSALAGGGFLLAAYTKNTQADAAEADDNEEGTFSPSAFISITPKGQITLLAHKPEIGQGVKTTLPMIIAEELDVAWEDVHVEQAPADSKAFGGQTAGGSQSVRQNYKRLRQLGAAARSLLVQAAANQSNIPAEKLVTDAGKVIDPASKKSISYGDLATDAAKLPAPKARDIKLKDPKDFKLLGKRIGGVDNEEIVTGKPLFGIDQQVKGLKHAAYLRCPVFGGKVVSANLDTVKKIEGIIDVFILEGKGGLDGLLPGVAVIANSTWEAQKGLEALEVKWDYQGKDKESFSENSKQVAAMITKAGAKVTRKDGDTDFTPDVEGTYYYPHVAHNTLEPQNCTALFKDNAIEIWAPTQNPRSGRGLISNALGIAADAIKINMTRIGGGFGRRLICDFMVESAAIAKKMPNVPVKLTWSRTQDLQHDYYRTGGWHHLRGKVSDDGKVAAWTNHFVTFGTNSTSRPGRGANMRPMEFPSGFVDNYKLEQTILSSNVPLGWWRAPGSCGLAFAIQGFLDELAHKAKKDPLQFKVDFLANAPKPRGYNTQRMISSLKLAAEKSGWGKKMPKGSGQGIAFHYSHQGYVAIVADVSVSPDGKLKINELTAGVNVGPIMNLSGAENQVEGSMLDGLSTAWFQRIDVEGGAVKNTNFTDYPVLRMKDAPKLGCHFVKSDAAPTGLGEPALPPTAPAICNAIFAATGKRVRSLPLREEDLSWKA